MPPSLENFRQATVANTNLDAFAPAMQAVQWEVLGAYLQPMDVPRGEQLIDANSHERSVFFIESGSVSVHRLSSTGVVRIAMVHAGSVVGEGAFFSYMSRTASVTAIAACKVWRLSPQRFSEMASRQPDVAVEVLLALGQVMARRQRSRSHRVAVT